ncbi:hypothetical protein GCM10010435_93780 [Winogradskya consettensis]|uniref:Uncharacterized protein n=1 Tax=Winogradskya consettensis TaxID=113560 RepID=A0A919W0Q8_9ACTN|nr:hypothetical protein [Actinoplanes consettensis]GIM84506.1 hypothetical protein Aco04nite_91730 [Actinoplanes consettensis]
MTITATLTAHALNVGIVPAISDRALAPGRISHVDATASRTRTGLFARARAARQIWRPGAAAAPTRRVERGDRFCLTEPAVALPMV